MPDPNGVPGGVPQQPQYNYQQPQQAQNNYQQPQQPWNQQPQQPQYNYQQPQRPQQYNYQQPQPQQPYGTRQQPQQPQYGYQQPQYGYQPVPPTPYGIQRQAAPAVTHKKAIGSMIMMFIALSFLAYPLFYSLVSGFRKGSPSDRFLRGQLQLEDGAVRFAAAPDQGNVVLSSTIGCRAFLLIPAGSPPVPAGATFSGFMI